MDKSSLKKLLENHKKGKIAIDELVKKLNFYSYKNIWLSSEFGISVGIMLEKGFYNLNVC